MYQRFLKQIYLKKGYEKQILNYSIEKFNLIVKNEMDMLFSSKTLIKADKNGI